MGFTAIICEFNPLHNGHKALLEYAKTNYDDPVVCLMSGNFVQRGEAAILNKYERAVLAIKEGSDLVLELPPFFAISNAETFANGAISILNKLNVERVIFGSECGDITLLEKLADISLCEPEKLKERISYHLNNGLLFATARSNAIKEVFGKELYEASLTPNNILGIEYIKAIKKLNSNIKPITIKRLSDEQKYISSSIIRNSPIDEKLEKYIPKSSLELLKNRIDTKAANEILFTLLKYKRSSLDSKILKNIAEVTEGLENRILKAIKVASSYDDLCEKIKSKRYTMAKIKRILLSVLLDFDNNLSKDGINELSYANALAVSYGSEKLLKGNTDFIIAKSERDIPIKDKFFEYENKADMLYATITNSPLKKDVTSVRIVK